MTTIVTDVQQPDYPKYQQTKNFELTQEEAEVWVACVNGSSIIMPTFTVAAMGYGLCKLSSFRSYAGYAGIISGMVGMIVGRIVISRKCLKKVASMPNSTLTERLIEAGYYRGRPMPHRYRSQARGKPLEALRRDLRHCWALLGFFRALVWTLGLAGVL